MNKSCRAALTAIALMGTAMLASIPAKADVGFGISFGYDGGYFSDPCDYYDYYDQAPPWGLPPDYCDYPVYFEPVYFGGSWYRGPIYYRWYGGERMYWLNGGWRRDEWRGSRPSSIRWSDRGGWHGRDGWNNRDRGGWGHNGWGPRDFHDRSDFRGDGGREGWNRGGDRGDWNRGGDHGTWGNQGHFNDRGNPGYQGGSASWQGHPGQGGGNAGGGRGGGFQGGGRGGWSGGQGGGGHGGQSGDHGGGRGGH